MTMGPKKRLVIASLLALTICLILALASGSIRSAIAQEPPPPEEVRVTAADDGREITLTEDKSLVVTLEANPSTGYTWQIADAPTGPEGEEILRLVGPIEFQPDSSLLGAPGTQILRFQAVAEGQAPLGLVYGRPWEPDREPAKTFSLEVRAVGPFTGASGVTPPAMDRHPGEVSMSGQQEAASDLPSAFNWCDLGGCTPVKDQGACGSCWAFGTVGPLELNTLIRDGLEKDLSEQYLVSCNTDNWGCNGGLWAHDYHAWKIPPGDIGAGGVDESDLPYVATDDPCNPPHLHRHRIESWHYVGSAWGVPSTSDVKRAIYDHGPVSAAVCVDPDFQSYSGGVFEGPGCEGVNHAVVLVGWDDSQGSNGAWVLRNSWGDRWGESGYMRIGYGVSRVGLGANYVEYSSSNCYSLTTDVSPAGSGTTMVDPPPNCGSRGYEPNTEVQVTANPGSGWHFTHWSGAASGESRSTGVLMDSHKSVTAHFGSNICIPSLALPLTIGVAALRTMRHRRIAPRLPRDPLTPTNPI